MKHIIAILLLASSASSLRAEKSGLTLLNPRGSELKFGIFTVDLGDVNGEGIGRIFQGPIRIKRGGSQACTAVDNVELVGLPIGIVRSTLLYVYTFSGSTAHVVIIDTQTCATRWTSAGFGNRAIFTKFAIRLFEAGTFHIGHDGLPVR